MNNTYEIYNTDTNTDTDTDTDTDHTLESIETKIIAILYANINTQFTHNTLFDKLIKDKYGDKTIGTDSYFKAKYLMVLMTLNKKFDDVYTKIEYSTVEELDKTFCYWFSIVCTDDYFNYQPQSQPFVPNNVTEHIFTLDDSELFFRLIIETNSNIKFPNGNTVFHELVITKQIELINEYVSKDIFDMNCTNDDGLTPVQINMNPCINLYLNNVIIQNNIRQLNQKLDLFKNIVEQNRIYIKETKEHLKNLNKTTNMLLETTTSFEKNTKYLEQLVISNNLFVRTTLIIGTLNLCLYLFSYVSQLSPDTDSFT